MQSSQKITAAVGIVLSVLAAVVVLWVVGLPTVPQLERAVPFRALTLEDEVISISASPGQPVVLNFWATWCVPCVVEMPRLEAAYQAHRAAGLLLIGVNVGEDPSQVQTWVAEHNINFPIVIDRYFEIEKAYEVRQIYPSTFFIDARGNIVRVHQGPLSEDDLADYLAELGLH